MPGVTGELMLKDLARGRILRGGLSRGKIFNHRDAES